MEAIILAGGLGTRLREAVPDLPKPLAPIQGKPFLDLLLHQLTRSKLISKAILAIGYRAQDIVNHYTQNPHPLPIGFSIEESPLGTGGALKKALQLTTSEWILVLNGDSYFDIDLTAFCHHTQNSIACAHVADTSRFGRVDFDPQTHQILTFTEKATTQGPGWINGGIYLLHRTVLDTYPETFSLEKELFPKLTLHAFPAKGLFIDIGTGKSFAEAQTLLAEVSSCTS